MSRGEVLWGVWLGIAATVIGKVRPTQREERSDIQDPNYCADCGKHWEQCYCMREEE